MGVLTLRREIGAEACRTGLPHFPFGSVSGCWAPRGTSPWTWEIAVPILRATQHPRRDADFDDCEIPEPIELSTWPDARRSGRSGVRELEHGNTGHHRDACCQPSAA